MKELFVPGRTELSGNHTDHQLGRILASAVDMGFYARFEKNAMKHVLVRSAGFEDIDVRIDQLNVRTKEFGTSRSLVRGMLGEFASLGLRIGGFSAEIRSTLPVG